MIEEMSEAGELRCKLQWVEHDLEHVAYERDKCKKKLDEVYVWATEALAGRAGLKDALSRIQILAKI